ncbi:unnamed protein product [marine sediment metagenome]|uniref:Uncharacterized protein n=1 Tax=marine sediment metagenome TaxID=412755 RepID=X1CCI5_9ZZZZ
MKYTKADTEFSIYIRRRDADEYGVCKCAICENQWEWKYMVCGHFIKRRILVTRWHSDNAFAICSNCNGLMEGDPALEWSYGLYVLHRIGTDAYSELMMLRQTQPKYTQRMIDEIADKYRKLNK